MTENDDMEGLFKEAMVDVRPLKKSNRCAEFKKPLAQVPESTLRARRKAAQQEDKPGSAALSEFWVEPIDPEQKLDYSTPGIQPTRVRQLRQGLLPIQYQLDLHGYTIDEARKLILEFLLFCRNEGLCHVRIIHGKSHRSAQRQNTLKSHVNHWLRQFPEVLAFCSAPPAQGGTGAVLVLLKRKVW